MATARRVLAWQFSTQSSAMSNSLPSERCDLCGSTDYTHQLELTTGRAMRSDRGVVPSNLSKLRCSRCGLVRSGQQFDQRALQAYYADSYTLSVQPEHYFYTRQGQVSRSSVLCNWLVDSMGAYRWQSASRCLEIGAGAGLLLQEFMQRFPGQRFEGVELNQAAVAQAQQHGLPVLQRTMDDLEPNRYDIVYSVAVIEHVPSPTEFLTTIRSQLKPGGWLFLCQPTQDVASYDLFFFDHLHHFGSEHLRQYARKCGFSEYGLVVGHELMPNFSLHLWRASDEASSFEWHGPAAETTCAATARQVMANMAGLDTLMSDLAQRRRRVAAFGLNEVYWLARAYSSLGDFPLVCGLDDAPDRPEYARLEFPVLTPEACVSLQVQDVLLTMNKIYYPQALSRLAQLGLRGHPVLS
jgi:2-polyprenyl-3-methyl-5-hydroxy-6-metoxy-1,4-benzoquinol methylase